MGILDSIVEWIAAQVMNLLRVCFRQNPVQEALNQMLEDAYSGRSESTT